MLVGATPASQIMSDRKFVTTTTNTNVHYNPVIDYIYVQDVGVKHHSVCAHSTEPVLTKIKKAKTFGISKAKEYWFANLSPHSD